MYVYIVMAFLIFIFGTSEKKRYMLYIKDNTLDSRLSNRRNIFYFLLVLTFLIIGGFRYRVGTDFGAYYALYQTDWNELLTQFQKLDEPGIYLLTFLCRKIWDEGIFVIFVENAVITLLIFRGIRSYRLENITMSLLMYMFYCGWAFSFNGIRQAIAMAIIFAFSKQERKDWLIKYVLIVFVAFLFHKSALFMLPILIIAHGKLCFRQLFFIVLFAILTPYFGEYALSYMGMLPNSTDVYFTNDINPLRIIIACVPLLLIVLLYLKNQEEFFEKNYFIINMVIINAVLTYVTASSAYMNRFARFTSVYIMIFFPKFSSRLTKKSQALFNIIAISLYFIVFLVEIQSSGNLIPFQWSFSHFGEY